MKIPNEFVKIYNTLYFIFYDSIFSIIFFILALFSFIYSLFTKDFLIVFLQVPYIFIWVLTWIKKINRVRESLK